MEISVIIPTYGSPVLLAEAVQSVLDQTFSDWELIVVDDNDPDSTARKETEELIHPFTEQDSRIRCLCHPKNMNGAAARNTGIRAASGKYIAFLDSDDHYTETRLERCYEVMEHASEEVAFVYTGCEFRKGGKTYRTYAAKKNGQYLLEALACTFPLFTGSNLFVRKHVIDELGGFDERFLRHQDSELITRIFENYAIASIPDVLVVKNNENWNLPDVERMRDVEKLFLDTFRSQIEQFSEKEQKYIYHSHWIYLAELAVRFGSRKTARYHYRLAGMNGRLTVNEWLRRAAFTLLRLQHGMDHR